MTRTHAPHPLLAQLEAVLDVHGAKPARWPEEVRAELLAFTAQDPQAARLLAEAEALDRLLGRGPSALPQGLDARILAAAAALPQTNERGAAIRLNSTSTRRANRGLAQPAGGRRIWPELTLLAASLFLGLLIGVSGQALPALQSVAALAGDEDGWGISGLLFDDATQKEAL
jgi:hypothetical protein